MILLNKNTKYIFMGLLAMISTQMVIRSVGIDNLSAQLIDLILGTVSILIIVVTYKYRNKGFGFRYNMTVAILATLSCFFGGVMVTIEKCFPNLNDKYKTSAILVFTASFFAILLFMIIHKIVYNIKQR